MKNLASLTTLGLFALASAPLSHATLLVYEGFDYGGADSAIAGLAGSGSGTQGNWTVTNAGTSSSSYQAAGLSFGANFPTSVGGALKQSGIYNGDASQQTTATLRLNTSTTGTLWSSYLVSFTHSAANGGFGRQGVAGDSTGSSVNLLSQLYSNTNASDRKLGTGYDATPTPSGNTAFAASTTYLIVSSFTNVGLALDSGTTGVATSWAFTVGGYDSWMTTGGGLESNLDSYAVRKISDAAVSSGSYGFDSIGYVAFQTNAPNFNNNSFNAVYDELRYGTTLTDVVSAIPEPSAYAAILGGLALAGVASRRRSRTA